MIITPSTFSFLFRNVNKSHTLASYILEEQANKDIDVIFFQELTQKNIRNAAHIDHVHGEPVIGLPLHPSWICLPPPSLISQVAIYIHLRIFHRYHFTVDKIIFGHPNIFAMFCYDSDSDITMAYLNVYANPNRDCHTSLKNTIPTLLAQLYKVSNLRLVQGDFNLHCPYWDDDSDDNPAIAWELIRCFHDKHLSLINDESIPTFFRANNRAQVLDLIWLHDDAQNWHGVQVLYDIQGADVDHKTLTLRIGSQENASFNNNHLLRTYIPSGSEEEEQLVFHIFRQLPSWTMADPNAHAQAMIDAFNDGWNQFAKPGSASYNRWWNDSCLMMKLLYQARPCNDT